MSKYLKIQFKRNIAIFLLLLFLCNFYIPDVSAISNEKTDNSYTDVNEDAVYYEAVTTLNSLGILELDEKEGFKPDSSVTRAEFASIITKILGMDNLLNEQTKVSKFIDVPVTNLASKYINNVFELGLMEGYGDKFGPEEFITYEQAIKVIINSLGYTIVANGKGGYPTGYLMVASEKNITKKIDLAVGKYAKRSDIAQMIFNALDVDLMNINSFNINGSYKVTPGQTLLSEKMKVIKGTGQVTANYTTKLKGKSTLKKDEVEIGGNLYKIGHTNANNLLGYQVTYYSKEENDQDVLLAIQKDKKSGVVKVNSEDINADTNLSRFAFWKNDGDRQPEKLDLDKNASVIYNGEYYPEATDGNLKPLSGSVVLLDSNGDNLYDVIFVSSYETYVVDNVDVNTKRIYFKYDASFNGNAFIELDSNDSSYKFTLQNNNKDIELKDIKEWSVLSIVQSVYDIDKKLLVIVTNNTIKGIATEKNNDENKIGIDAKIYKVLNDLDFNNIKLDTKYTFYLDFQDKIVAFEQDPLKNNNYAYLVKTSYEPQGVKDYGSFRLFTANGKFINLDGTDKIKFNGETKQANGNEWTSTTVATVLYNSPQLITYKKNSEGKICELNTAHNNSISNDPNYLGFSKDEFSLDYVRDTSVAHTPAQRIRIVNSLVFDSKYYVTDHTILFMIPSDIQAEKDYFIGSGSDIQETIPKINLYDATEDFSVNVAVCLGISNTTGGTLSNLLLIDKVTNVVNIDGENVYKIYGLSNKGSTTYNCVSDNLVDTSQSWVSSGTKTSDLKQGDMIVVFLNGSGKVKNFRVIYHSGSNQGYYESGGAASNDIHGDNYYAYAKVINKGGTSVLFNSSGNGTDMTLNKNIMFGKSNFFVCIYDSQNKKVSMATASDIQKGDNIVIGVYRTDSVKCIVIIR